MSKTILLLATLGTLTLAGTATAAVDPCAPLLQPPTKPKHRKPKAKPPVVTPAPIVPTCTPGIQGTPGQNGTNGKDGRPGRDGVNGRTYTHGARAGLGLRVGLVGILYSPHADWAWGPALQLSQPVGERGEFVIDAGLAMPADGWVANETGVLLHAGYARYFAGEPRLGLTLGVTGASLSGSTSNNNNTDANYLGGTLGAVVRIGRVRGEFGVAVSGLKDDTITDVQLGAGLNASIFVGF